MSNNFIVTLIFCAALARCNEKPAEANPKMAAFLRKILEKPQPSKNNQLADAPHPMDGTLDMNIDSITPSSSDDKNTANEALKNLSNLRSIRQGKKVLGYYALISCLECYPPKITTALYDAHKRLVGQLYESHSARVTITDENFSVEETQQLMSAWQPELKYEIVTKFNN